MDWFNHIRKQRQKKKWKKECKAIKIFCIVCICVLESLSLFYNFTIGEFLSGWGNLYPLSSFFFFHFLSFLLKSHHEKKETYTAKQPVSGMAIYIYLFKICHIYSGKRAWLWGEQSACRYKQCGHRYRYCIEIYLMIT